MSVMEQLRNGLFFCINKRLKVKKCIITLSINENVVSLQKNEKKEQEYLNACNNL